MGHAAKNTQETIATLRRKMERIGGAVPAPAGSHLAALQSVEAPQHTVEAPPHTVASPEWIQHSLESGGLPRAAITHVSDCPIAHIDMLAALTHAGQCAAIVGYPQLALAAVDAAGGDLERIVLIPDPAPHETAVLGTLVEGMDLVLYRPSRKVTPTFARPVEARLRKSHCALVVAGQPWPRVNLHLNISVVGVSGLGRGSGRIKSVELAGKAWGTAQPPSKLHGVIEKPYVDSDSAPQAPEWESAEYRGRAHRGGQLAGQEPRYPALLPQEIAQ